MFSPAASLAHLRQRVSFLPLGGRAQSRLAGTLPLAGDAHTRLISGSRSVAISAGYCTSVHLDLRDPPPQPHNTHTTFQRSSSFSPLRPFSHLQLRVARRRFSSLLVSRRNVAARVADALLACAIALALSGALSGRRLRLGTRIVTHYVCHNPFQSSMHGSAALAPPPVPGCLPQCAADAHPGVCSLQYGLGGGSSLAASASPFSFPVHPSRHAHTPFAECTDRAARSISKYSCWKGRGVAVTSASVRVAASACVPADPMQSVPGSWALVTA